MSTDDDDAGHRRAESAAAHAAAHRRVPARGDQARAAPTCISSPAIRRASACNGELQSLRDAPLDKEFVRDTIYDFITRRAQQQLEEKDGADFAYSIPGVSRFRVNVFRHIGGLGAVLRAIPSKALTLEQLNMPAAVRSLCRVNNGLILVTGKTGSGKSTTLAAMIDDINAREKGHILTIEDPIEFVHPRKNCLVSQREVGLHSPGFAEALHSALREDPDIVLVGELRDLETMSIAVTAAEMGILVMGTLHTNGAAPTVDRIVNAFPADKQGHVRTMLSTSLRGVISQQLIHARRQARAGRRARDPHQHAGRLQPDPPGQARPARERDAERRAPTACGSWTRRSRNCSRRA